MPYSVREFRQTPNPNAVKCVLDRSMGDGRRSYFNAGQAAGDVVAARLFDIDGVTNVLIHGDWITVGKRADAPWAPIRKAVERILRGVE